MINQLALGQRGQCLCDERTVEKALAGNLKDARKHNEEDLCALEYTYPSSSFRCKACGIPEPCISYAFAHLEKEKQCSDNAFSHHFPDYLKRYMTGTGPHTSAEKAVKPNPVDVVEPGPVDYLTDCPFCSKAFADEGDQKARHLRHLEGTRCKGNSYADLEFAFKQYVRCYPLGLFHVRDVERMFVCVECHADFNDFSYLTLHTKGGAHTSVERMHAVSQRLQLFLAPLVRISYEMYDLQ